MRVTGIGPRLVIRPARRLGPLVWTGRCRPLGLRLLARPGLGGVRPGVCGRGGLCLRLSPRARQCGVAGAGRGRAPLGLHWRHGGRDRLPARLLDGRLPPPGVARRLRRLDRGSRRLLPVPATLGQGIRFEHVSFSVSRHRAPWYWRTFRSCCQPGQWSRLWARTARARAPWSSCWPKCTSPTSGVILVDDVPLGAPARGRMARAAGGRLPGFFPLRISRPCTRSGLGDVPLHGRFAGGELRPSSRPGPADVVEQA